MEVLAAVAQGEAPGYKIRDENKLRAVAGEYGIETEGKDTLAVAAELADAMMED